MPIVAQHNLTHRSEGHVASEAWPQDCMVQWGGNGVVLQDKGPGYRTAFFEAFPKGGGFFRGEGETIADAEASCLAKFRAFEACAHAWSRKGYTNGGAICRNCGAFNSVFAPIVKLGSWKEPLEASTLDLVAEGAMRPDPEDARSHRYHRRSWLKARRMGIDLPDFDSAPEAPRSLFEEDAYARDSRKAVVTFLRAHREILETDEKGRGIEGLFAGLHISSLKRMLEEADSEVQEVEDLGPDM